MPHAIQTSSGAIGAPPPRDDASLEAFWKPKGIQIIRRGSWDEIDPHQSGYLLLDEHSSVRCRLDRDARATLRRERRVALRVLSDASGGYTERLELNETDTFQAIRRVYDSQNEPSVTVALVAEAQDARRWACGIHHPPLAAIIERHGNTSVDDPLPIEAKNAHADRPSARVRLDAALTRSFDIVFSLGALLVSAPLFPFIMAAICLEDGRPVFYSQERLGRNGRPFRLLKFRTMVRDADRRQRELGEDNTCDGPQFHIPSDPRALKCGAFLRRWSLDELPQFLNVLRGDMSVVGPRPLAAKENGCAPSWRDIRLSVKPGVTGLWQIKRTREPELDFQEWVRYDTEYVRRRSLALDLWIASRTLGAIVNSARRTLRRTSNDQTKATDEGVLARIDRGRVIGNQPTNASQDATKQAA